MFRETRNEHVVAQLKERLSKLSKLLRRCAVAMKENDNFVRAVAMRIFGFAFRVKSLSNEAVPPADR